MSIRRVIYVAILLMALGPLQVEAISRLQGPQLAASPSVVRPESQEAAHFARGIERLPPVNDTAKRPEERESPEHQETLDEAWSIATAVDRQLRAKQWQVSSAEQNLQAAEARRWPNASFGGSYVGRSTTPSFTFDLSGMMLPTSRSPFAQRESASFRAGVGVPLYTGGSISASVKAAQARISSAAMDVAGSRNDLRLWVAESYVAVLRAQRTVGVVEKTEKSLRSHASDVKLLHRQKQVPRQDLLAADVALLNAEQHVIQARNQLDLARAAYNRILARPLTLPVRIADLPVTDGRYDVDQLTQHAIATRPAVARYAAEIEALEQRSASLLGIKRPQVELRGDYNFSENRYQSPEGIATIGVVVEWNVYDHGQIGHEAKTLLHQAESLRWALKDLKSRIALEVRQRWLDIQETRRRLEVTPQAYRQADENLQVARNRYALGAAISTEVLDAQTQRIQAYTNHSNAIYDAVMAVIRLHHAVGISP